MGFEIVSLHVVPQPHSVGCPLRQCEPAAIQAMPWAEAQALIRNLQQIVTEWQRPGAPPASPPASAAK